MQDQGIIKASLMNLGSRSASPPCAPPQVMAPIFEMRFFNTSVRETLRDAYSGRERGVQSSGKTEAFWE